MLCFALPYYPLTYLYSQNLVFGTAYDGSLRTVLKLNKSASECLDYLIFKEQLDKIYKILKCETQNTEQPGACGGARQTHDAIEANDDVEDPDKSTVKYIR